MIFCYIVLVLSGILYSRSGDSGAGWPGLIIADKQLWTILF